MAEIRCIVVTPERTALETTSDFVAIPLCDGELGILPGRAPLIGRLGFGELRLRSGNQVTRYYLDGGFVQVVGDTVTLLTERAVPAGDVNAESAHDQLRHALQRPIATREQESIRDRLVAQARAQIRVSGGDH
ncbi:MAG: F0F1 ATP synthase subunit epsilon [Planctomycetes bacterium]|nr:F0F1 ATP synthase subunit epsilon [Planctomycetota bacterium]